MRIRGSKSLRNHQNDDEEENKVNPRFESKRRPIKNLKKAYEQHLVDDDLEEIDEFFGNGH